MFSRFNPVYKYFKSYGQKTGGLLARIITDTKICNFDEMIKSIPIDRHDIEISYLTRIINLKKINSKEINELSNCYVKIGSDLNINPSDIDKFYGKSVIHSVIKRIVVTVR